MSKALDNTVEVTIDVSELTPVQRRNNTGLGAVDLEMNADLFLQKQRCRVEAKFIKSSIAYKVHNDIALSANEKRYLQAWMKEASQTKALLPQADLLVPSKPSQLSLSQALTPEDFYALNTLPRVSI